MTVVVLVQSQVCFSTADPDIAFSSRRRHHLTHRCSIPRCSNARRCSGVSSAGLCPWYTPGSNRVGRFCSSSRQPVIASATNSGTASRTALPVTPDAKRVPVTASVRMPVAFIVARPCFLACTLSVCVLRTSQSAFSDLAEPRIHLARTEFLLGNERSVSPHPRRRTTHLRLAGNPKRRSHARRSMPPTCCRVVGTRSKKPRS